MSFRRRLIEEGRAVLWTTAYFAAWFAVLIVLKELILEEYQIEFRGLSMALVGALVVAKVVLVLEHVPLGRWALRRPALVEVILRTLFYALGAFVVLLLEKAFEARHESGGFGPALAGVLHHRDVPHVWANTICVASALFGFNALAVVRRYLGDAALTALFLSSSPPPPPPPRASQERGAAPTATDAGPPS
jgi:hypothetical protein